jgi:hypothetical protein
VLALLVLAYQYIVEWLGQELVERAADDRRNDSLAERLDLDRFVHAWGPEAPVDLLDGGEVSALDLLGGEGEALR